MKIAVVGSFYGTGVAGSLARAASASGFEVLELDTGMAEGSNRLVTALFWRLADKRPPHLRAFAAQVVERCAAARPDLLVSTGSAALTEETLNELRKHGTTCVNFSTDDPWNSTGRSQWYLRALPRYDVVFTPRRANVDDFVALGCRDVRYLPFGYDEFLVEPAVREDGAASEVLFVGGGDRDRVSFMSSFMKAGPPVSLVGGYWEKFSETRARALGQRTWEELCQLTKTAKINLCLVRRANRDGHVMRSFEIAALGGCMLVEDTGEHREIFGPDGECVVYFDSPEQAARRAWDLLADETERLRLGQAVLQRITASQHSYRERLHRIVDAKSYAVLRS